MGKLISHIIILIGFVSMALGDNVEKQPMDAVLRVTGIALLVVGICGCIFAYMATLAHGEENRTN